MQSFHCLYSEVTTKVIWEQLQRAFMVLPPLPKTICNQEAQGEQVPTEMIQFWAEGSYVMPEEIPPRQEPGYRYRDPNRKQALVAEYSQSQGSPLDAASSAVLVISICCCCSLGGLGDKESWPSKMTTPEARSLSGTRGERPTFSKIDSTSTSTLFLMATQKPVMAAAETEKWTPSATLPYFFISSCNRPVNAILSENLGKGLGAEESRERDGNRECDILCQSAAKYTDAVFPINFFIFISKNKNRLTNDVY